MVLLVGLQAVFRQWKGLTLLRISLPIGVFAATIMALTIKSRSAPDPIRTPLKDKIVSLDLGGSLLVLGKPPDRMTWKTSDFKTTGSMACLVYALEKGGVSRSWQNWRIITGLAAFLGLFVVFVFNEWCMGDRAMIQSHLFQKRSVVLNLIYMFFLAGLFFPLSYTLPIQFQSIDNASASQSGVRLIPLVLGVSVFTMVTNGVLTVWRQYTPFLVVGAVAGTIGVAMVHTLGADAAIGSWIGYEILTAMGVGLALQVPMIANQAAVGVEDIAGATALTLFCENVGTSIFIASTEAALMNGLISALRRNVPNVHPEAVISVGATEIRRIFGSDQIHGILLSYLRGCKDSHFVPIACGGAATLVSMALAAPGVAQAWENQKGKLHAR